MNWYLVIKTAQMLRTAEPHYFSECPKCEHPVLADLLWEKRLTDPTVWVIGRNGQPLDKTEAMRNPAEVASWHSRERLKCPNCGTTYYTMVTKQLHPVADIMPRDQIDSIGDQPPEHQYNDPVLVPD